MYFYVIRQALKSHVYMHMQTMFFISLIILATCRRGVFIAAFASCQSCLCLSALGYKECSRDANFVYYCKWPRWCCGEQSCWQATFTDCPYIFYNVTFTLFPTYDVRDFSTQTHTKLLQNLKNKYITLQVHCFVVFYIYRRFSTKIRSYRGGQSTN